MRCSEAKRLISEYVDGELGPDKEKALQSHLDACVDCRELASDFQKIAREAKNLPSLSPSPLVWQRIAAGVGELHQEERISKEKRAFWLSSLLQPRPLRYALASLLALVIVGGGLMIGLKPRKAAAPGVRGSVDFTVAKLKEAELYYEKAIQAMNEAIQSQKNGMDPQLAEAFGENLDAIDRTILACQRLVQKDPGNMAAQAYLLTAYQEKADFLERIMSVERTTASKEIGTTL